MTRQVPQILLALLISLLLGRCAQIGTLDGGKKDATPPKLIQALPADKSIGFNSDKIILRFDEFIQIKDLTNQLLVSPKLKTPPDITASGRFITIVLKKEELSLNTTYRFYFGNAIADMNESNTLQNFEYVFSTGNSIDSLKLKGTIVDAFTTNPVGKVIVGLYNASAMTDSTPYIEVPDYISRTSDNGEFAFGNLPYRKFNVVAFSDNNKSNVYDGETEKVAFRDSVLDLRSDTSIRLRLFQEESLKGFIKKSSMPYYGFGQIFLNKKANVYIKPVKDELIPNISEINTDANRDTISFFYKDIRDTFGLVVTNITFKKVDTLRLIAPKNVPAKKRLKRFNTNIQSNSLALNNTIKISFLNWMDTTKNDLSKIQLKSKVDSIVTDIPVNGRWKSITDYEITNKLKDGVSYTLKVDTLAFFDLNGFTNDSLNSTFKTQSKTEFGTVTLKLLVNRKQNYIIQLTLGGDIVVKQQFASFSLSSSNAVSLIFTDVPPAVYTAKIIFDDNDNKKWDSGNLLSKQQPERVIINSKQLKVLSDWEIEEEITIKE